ncbi:MULTISPECIES: hypothetical protein [Sphingobacterium]|uniref:hypothetical protein n=1 Tax=Sphingobacterium TaxID=28453 RepID=UPI00257E3809|nr:MULTISPECIES: hypothetical protein [Sphingobacterium]
MIKSEPDCDLESLWSNGRAVKDDDYPIIKWLNMDEESGERFSVAYVESFDERNDAYKAAKNK